MKIISITGTKGKTTVTRGLSHVLHKIGENTLRVDTDGHWVNEKQKSTLGESKSMFGLVPTVCPGKFLLDMKNYHPDFTAILETAIGSSRRGGLGYRRHAVGIFTNVLEDHLGASKRLKTRSDIAKAKRFIFSAIAEGGYAVFNADDKLVCSQLVHVPEKGKVKMVPVGFDHKYFNVENHLKKGGVAFSVQDGHIILKSKTRTKKLLKVEDISWTFGGNFRPSIYNLMFILAGLYSFNGGRLPEKYIEALKGYALDSGGGRLTIFENRRGVRILVDYAHEKYSIKEVAGLARKMCRNGTIGVLRLAPDRTDKMIRETGRYISDCFDYVIVYDKIDGVSKKRYISTGLTPTRKAGEVSGIFLAGIRHAGKKKNSERIIREEGAIKRAAEIAKRGDVVIIICGDDREKSINWIKKYFKASLKKGK